MVKKPARPAIFKGRETEPEFTLWAVRWCRRYSLSLRDVEELLVDRGLEAGHTTIWPLGSAIRYRTGPAAAQPSQADPQIVAGRCGRCDLHPRERAVVLPYIEAELLLPRRCLTPRSHDRSHAGISHERLARRRHAPCPHSWRLLLDPRSFRGTRRLKFGSFGRRCYPWLALGFSGSGFRPYEEEEEGFHADASIAFHRAGRRSSQWWRQEKTHWS